MGTGSGFAWGASPPVLGVGVFAGGFVAQTASVLSAQNASGEPIIWLPGGLLLAVLVRVPRTRWGTCLLAMLFGVALAGACSGMSFTTSVFAVAALAFVPLAAHVLQRPFVDASPLRVFRTLAYAIGIFVIAVPAASATAMVAAHYHVDTQTQTWMDWSNTALAHALGYMLFLPIWLRSGDFESLWRKSNAPGAHLIGGALLALGLIWVAWRTLGTISYLQPLLLLAPVPVAAVIAFRTRLLETHVFMVLVAIIAIGMSLAGQGPFLEPGALQTALSAKSWVLAMTVASCFLAVLIEERAAVRHALANSTRQLRRTAGWLIEAQEQERSRIARDLHDDINQRLASASIELSIIRRTVDAHAQIELGHLQDGLIALSEDVRYISHSLHPSMLHETGLNAAIGALCSSKRHRNGPSIDMEVAETADGLPDAIALCLYRAAQEALGNAIRHARAAHIRLTLQVDDGQAQLSVEDDGVGFTVGGEGTRPRGLGLLSIEERAKLLGGSFQLRSNPGKGAHLCIRIPLQH